MHHNLPMDKEMNLIIKNKPELENSSSMQTDEIGQIDGVVKWILGGHRREQNEK